MQLDSRRSERSPVVRRGGGPRRRSRRRARTAPGPRWRSARRARGRRPRSARRTRRARSRGRAGSRRRARRPAPTWRAQPATSAAWVPGGVNSGTLPAITHASNVRPRSSVARSCSIHSMPGAARAGGGEHRRVDVDPDDRDAAARELDRDPAGAAARVEHRRGRRDRASSTNAASPCTSTPLAASASKRA